MPLDIGDVEYIPARPQPQRFVRRDRRGRPLGDATTTSTGFFSSPEDLLRAAQQTNDYVSSIAAAVGAVKDWTGKGVPAGSGAALQAFLNGWTNFFASDFSSRARVLAHWFTSDMQGTLRNFQAQAVDWGAKLKKWGVQVVGTPPEVAGGAKNMFMWIGIGVVGLVGLFMLGKLIHTVALGGSELEEAENEAMRLVDEKRRKRHDKTAYSIT